jgi:hypothetical protein
LIKALTPISIINGIPKASLAPALIINPAPLPISTLFSLTPKTTLDLT